MKLSLSHLIGAVLATSLLATAAQATTTYTATEILPSGATSVGNQGGAGLSSDGRVTGQYQDGSGIHAFVTGANGSGITTLGGLTSNPSGSNVNSSGSVVGNDGSSTFLETLGGSPTTLASAQNYFAQINNSGAVAFSSGNNAYYQAAGGTATLINTSALGAYTYLSGMNSSGQVTGYTFGSGYGTMTSWVSAADGGAVTAIGATEPWGGGSGALVSTGISDNGTVVGWTYGSATGASGGWEYSGGILTTIASYADSYSSALTGVNDSGVAIGYEITGSTEQATVYSGGSYSLLSSVIDTGSTVSTLTAALGINDAGQILAQGTDSSGTQSLFLLTADAPIIAPSGGSGGGSVPEPALAGLLGLGLAGLVARRRRALLG